MLLGLSGDTSFALALLALDCLSSWLDQSRESRTVGMMPSQLQREGNQLHCVQGLGNKSMIGLFFDLGLYCHCRFAFAISSCLGCVVVDFSIVTCLFWFVK